MATNHGKYMPAYTPQEQSTAYKLAFGSDQPEERESLLQQSVSQDVVFTNPGGNGKTRTALSDHIADFRAKMPVMYFETAKVLVTQGDLLAVWSMHKPGGSKVATGYNFVP